MSAVRQVVVGTSRHPRVQCDHVDCYELAIGRFGEDMAAMRRRLRDAGWKVAVRRPGVGARIRDFCPLHASSVAAAQ